MSLNLRRFISDVKSKGIAQANRYEMVFGGKLSNNLIRDRVAEVSLAGLDVSTGDVRNPDWTWKPPYTNTKNDLTVSFIEHADHSIRKEISQWMDEIITVPNFTVGYLNDYSVGADVHVYNSTSNTSIKFEINFDRLYPINLAESSLGYSNNNQYLLTTCTFAYYGYSYDTGGGFGWGFGFGFGR